MKTFFLSVVALLSVAVCCAQDKVCGDYVYRCGLDKSPEEAKRIALERAKLEALAAKYGTVVSEQNFLNVKSSEASTQTDFESIGSTEVKGEWLETIGEPEYQISIEDNLLTVIAHVCGKAREIKRAAADFSAALLRSLDDRRPTTDFYEGDPLYLTFKSPANGYVACYLIGDDNMAYCTIPYGESDESAAKVKKDKEYTFFSPTDSDTPHIVDEYILTASKDGEHNQMYVIFSPSPFSKARDRALPAADFRKWLAKQRTSDPQMQVEIITISIHK